MSKVYIIDPNERFPVKIDSATFYIRRLTTRERRAIIKKRTNNKGITDYTLAGLEMIDKAVLGWEGIYRKDGDDDIPVPFSKEILLAMSEDILVVLQNAINSSNPASISSGEPEDELDSPKN